jgi:hypothetical protein
MLVRISGDNANIVTVDDWSDEAPEVRDVVV